MDNRLIKVLSELREEILYEIAYVKKKYGSDQDSQYYMEGRIDSLEYILQIVEELLL